MLSKSERGEQARNYFIGCEQSLKIAFKKQRAAELERAKGIAVRQALTKAIQQSSENERMHGHAYSTYTDVIYKSIFGKNAKQLREEFGNHKKRKYERLFFRRRVGESSERRNACERISRIWMGI